MNEKIKISLVATSAFAGGAACMAGFLAWTFMSTMKELNKPPRRYRNSNSNQKTDYSSANSN